MHCFTHRDAPVVAICNRCEKGLCGACAAAGDGRCPDCVALRRRESVRAHRTRWVLIWALLIMGMIQLAQASREWMSRGPGDFPVLDTILGVTFILNAVVWSIVPGRRRRSADAEPQRPSPP
jgi:hypothetical protein